MIASHDVTDEEVERFVSQYLGAEGGGRRTWVRRALEDFLASRRVRRAEERRQRKAAKRASRISPTALEKT